mmetsp:Transcript_74368/g.177203  ORF Transcript_74368/g.177203 Transcript_74368/m.177203 type:complete len:227 (-) Transcript_74368:296-976(-)
MHLPACEGWRPSVQSSRWNQGDTRKWRLVRWSQLDSDRGLSRSPPAFKSQVLGFQICSGSSRSWSDPRMIPSVTGMRNGRRAPPKLNDSGMHSLQHTQKATQWRRRRRPERAADHHFLRRVWALMSLAWMTWRTSHLRCRQEHRQEVWKGHHSLHRRSPRRRSPGVLVQTRRATSLQEDQRPPLRTKPRRLLLPQCHRRSPGQGALCLAQELRAARQAELLSSWSN